MSASGPSGPLVSLNLTVGGGGGVSNKHCLLTFFISSADNLFKQFGPRSGSTEC